MRGEAKPAVLRAPSLAMAHSQSISQLNHPAGRKEGAAGIPSVPLGALSHGELEGDNVRLHKPNQQNFPDLHFSLKSGR